MAAGTWTFTDASRTKLLEEAAAALAAAEAAIEAAQEEDDSLPILIALLL